MSQFGLTIQIWTAIDSGSAEAAYIHRKPISDAICDKVKHALHVISIVKLTTKIFSEIVIVL